MKILNDEQWSVLVVLIIIPSIIIFIIGTWYFDRGKEAVRIAEETQYWSDEMRADEYQESVEYRGY